MNQRKTCFKRVYLFFLFMAASGLSFSMRNLRCAQIDKIYILFKYMLSSLQLRHMGSGVAARGLSCLNMWDLSSPIRDGTHVSCIGRRFLSTGPARKSVALGLKRHSTRKEYVEDCTALLCSEKRLMTKGNKSTWYQKNSAQMMNLEAGLGGREASGSNKDQMSIDGILKNGISALIRTVYERAYFPSLFFAFEDILS